jgi:protein-tyrosine phosphatase
MSVAEELRGLTLEGTPFLLIEPPMMPWSETMLEEIEECGVTLRCIPVIAHVDRYMRVLEDNTLMERLSRRRVLVQFNASAFVRESFREQAMKRLRAEQVHFLGSDCHDMDQRRPNLGDATAAIRAAGEETLTRFHNRVRRALTAGK